MSIVVTIQPRTRSAPDHFCVYYLTQMERAGSVYVAFYTCVCMSVDQFVYEPSFTYDLTRLKH